MSTHICARPYSRAADPVVIAARAILEGRAAVTEGGHLKLPDGILWPVAKHELLYVRAAYAPLFEGALFGNWPTQRGAGAAADPTAAAPAIASDSGPPVDAGDGTTAKFGIKTAVRQVIIGQPGIGKSLFGYVPQ